MSDQMDDLRRSLAKGLMSPEEVRRLLDSDFVSGATLAPLPMSISPELDVLGDIRRTLIMRMAAAESEWDHGMLTDEGYRARKDAIVTEVAGLFRDTLRRTMGLEAGKDA